MSHRFALTFGLSLVVTTALLAQTTYTWNPATTGSQTWDTATAVWSNSGLAGPFDKTFVSGANSSALLSTNSTLTLTSSTALTLNDLRIASDGVTIGTGSGGSFLVNQGFQTVGGPRTLDLNVGGGNFTFQNVGPGNTTAGQLTLRISSTLDGGGAIFNTANAFGTTPNAQIVLNPSTATGGYGTRLVVNNASMASGVTLLMNATAAPDNRSTLRGSGTAAWNGAIQLSGTGFTQLDVTNASTFTVNGNIDSGANTTTLNLRSGTAATSNGILNGMVSGSTALWKSDPGVWRINQENNTFTGNVRVAAGTLQVAKLANGGLDSSIGRASTAVELGQGSSTDNAVLEYIGSTASGTDRGLTLQAGTTSTFTLRANGTTEAATVSYSGNLTNSSNNVTRSLVLDGSNAGTNTISGVIAAPTAGTLNVTKTGAGTWVLSGNNTYNGTTSVSAGTLVVNGVHTGSGAVTVGGGTLGGTGSLKGAVTVNAGGTVRGDSGTGTGTLTLNGDTTIAAGSTATTRGTLATRLTTDGNGAITANSKLALVGANTDLNFSGLSAGNTFDILLLNDSGLLAGQQYSITLAAAAAGTNFQRNGSGTDAFQASDFNLVSSSGQAFNLVSLDRNGSSLQLTFTPVPEPALMGVVIAVGAAGVAVWRRRRRI